MIYRFRSKAAGDVIMLGPHGDQMLALLGRTPAAKGIFEAADLPGLAARLEAAASAAAAGAAEEPEDDAGRAPVGLQQRLWPIIDMMKRSAAAQEPIVWGV